MQTCVFRFHLAAAALLAIGGFMHGREEGGLEARPAAVDVLTR